ncbi:MAG: hypothetical protein HY721_22225 [Planctomycetes bacterium]|nr:hypothetical protein [Planctomycetota bacterium]
MDLTRDAWRLARVDREPWQVWVPPQNPKPPHPPQRPEHIRRAEDRRQQTVAEKKRAAGIQPAPCLLRVELKTIPRMKLWQQCAVPLDVVLMREHKSDGEVSEWGLLTTREVWDPLEIRDLYGFRGSCEEGWRQSKCFWDLTGFRSCSYSLVVSQIIFVLLSYSLLQVFLIKTERGDLAKATRQRLLAELLPYGEKIAVYCKNRVGYFSVGEYTQIILTLEEGARRRLLGRVRRLQKSHLERPALPDRPT